MPSRKLQLNQWLIDMSSGEVWLFTDDLEKSMQFAPIEQIELKGVYLLKLLAKNAPQVIDKEQLLETIWTGQIVSEDSLTRCISRVRKVLNDDPKAPKIIETLPKRGYRMVATNITWHQSSNITPDVPEVSAKRKDGSLEKQHNFGQWVITSLLISAVFALGLFLVNPQPEQQPRNDAQFILSQADDYYMQMRRQDNEMAIELYQQAMGLRPDSAHAQAGLANAIVQQVIRWSNEDANKGRPIEDLGQAIDLGLTTTFDAQQKLSRAHALASAAIQADRRSARAYKALGFVNAAQQEFPLAIQHYQQAVQLDENAWDALLNIGDVLEIQGKQEEALPYFEQAFAAMTRVYNEKSAQIAPWYADIGAMIGTKYAALQESQKAERWYRHVLSFAPLNTDATKGLVTLLNQHGEGASAKRLCDEYEQRVGTNICDEIPHE
ncbi:winged helix-turn-helix domain-containing protein [Alteromonas flava]|uniref:winged helix-turn-helix domain-containing protein n=1 Tax=Alteromonas flava TaxID=2048003 RepID=UPI000C285A48|nr:winged helix-turn-helix domain-containing protein [Alteromonas flava]